MKNKTVSTEKVKDCRRTLRLSPECDEKLAYWADKEGYSVNAFIPVILDLYVDIKNGNYQLPTLEQRRLNQLIESIGVMSKDLQSLQQVVINGLDSLIGLTRGDNYLLEAETGEV